MSRFALMVKGGLDRSGITLRELCRQTDIDPSFLSKVLSGKRSPPGEEAALRRLAKTLELEPAELVVAAGRIPSEWSRLLEDSGLFAAVQRLIAAPHAEPPARGLRPAKAMPPRQPAPAFNEELL